MTDEVEEMANLITKDMEEISQQQQIKKEQSKGFWVAWEGKSVLALLSVSLITLWFVGSPLFWGWAIQSAFPIELRVMSVFALFLCDIGILKKKKNPSFSQFRCVSNSFIF